MIRTRISKLACVAAAGLLGSGCSAAFAAADPYIGEVMFVAGNFCPKGWATTDGQLLPIAKNEALFSLLGTRYGGDGRTNFALPKLNMMPTKTADANLIACIAVQGIYPAQN